MQTRSQLDRLEREFFPAFLGYAINRLHHLDEAEELAQEIACRATAAIRAGRTQSVDLDAYLWTLARNTFLDHIRRRNRAPMGETAMLGLAARLVEQGYLTHAEGRLCANVMRETPAVRAFFQPVNDELKPILTALCGDTAEHIRSIVRQTIPEQLRAYADGFTRIWIGTLAGNYFYEALADAGFLTVPESPNLPVACFVYVKSSS